MRLATQCLIICLATAALAQEQAPPILPTWQDEMAKGIVPYHHLTVDDFPINDKAHPKHAYYIKTAVDPHYRFQLRPTQGFVYAYVQHWRVFSGFDKSGTWRKSAFKQMKAELPYAQAILDISEIHARQLAALKPGELPSGSGATFQEAQAMLEQNLGQLLSARYKKANDETAAFVKATDNGRNKKKIRELAAEIRKRLDATPAIKIPLSESAGGLNGTPIAAPQPLITPAPTLVPR